MLPNESLQPGPHFVHVVHNPHYGPKGEPYCVAWQHTAGETREWYWTQSEAWERRDQLLDAGYEQVRVLGAPTVIAG